ncbi:MAG: two-component regulator propeller domain-containing protein, partial [Bacteroidota bacterium]
MILRYYSAALLIGILLNSNVVAQDLSFQQFDEDFPNRPIVDFVEDDRGFMWIATYGAGIYRFDGISYKSFLFDNQSELSLQSNFVLSAIQDSQNRIWTGTDAGLSYYDEQKDVFRRVVFTGLDIGNDENISILSILDDGNKHLLLGTERNGLLIVDLPSKTDSSLMELSVIAIVPDCKIRDMDRTDDGTIYVGGDNGFRRYSPEQNALVNLSEKSNWLSMPVKSVTTHGQTVWVGTVSNGLIKFEHDEGKTIVNRYPFTSKRIMDSKILNDHTLVCATENDGLI